MADPLNQQYDRITQILQERAAQPQYPTTQNQIDALGGQAYSNILSGRGPGNMVNDIQALQRQERDRPLNDQSAILKAFEMKKAYGDKQAQALDDRIKMFTGGDPEGTALILQELHADPEDIDPSNSFQTMTKIAGIVKKNGYQSPALLLDKQKKQLDLLKTESEINKNNSEAAKPLEKQNEKIRGQQQLEEVLSNIDSLYKGLNDEGGMTNTGFDPITNAVKRVQNSGFGQGLGTMFATDNQSKRNVIAGQIPLLTQAIKSATGMTAKQMDSNVELQNFLKAMTVQTNDYQANKAILSNLSKQFGSGETARKIAQRSQGNAPLISSKEQFDALPSGTVYMEDDGKMYRKP